LLSGSLGRMPGGRPLIFKQRVKIEKINLEGKIE